jgi:hypothetical protein
MVTVAWFSAGVSSAVATKLLIDEVDRIIYTHIEDQHPDTLRFVHDCEHWFGKHIEVLQSPYMSVENACRMSGGRGYVNGPGGAACTKFLKRRVRKEWEKTQTEPLRYVWGMDYGEIARCERLHETMPDQEHVFPLVDRKMSKEEAHKILSASGIKRPEMYELGYSNNNCIGCVKGGMGYWNHIRQDFPEVFEARAKMERVIQATCIKGVYLDELDPERGRHEPPIIGDCGILCELLAL